MSFHTFVDYAPGFPAPGIIVPQKVYVAQNAYAARAPIRFTENGTPGVSLRNALAKNFAGLVEGTPDFGGATRISLRINWPGYDDWTNTIHTSQTNAAVNNSRLAYQIARAVNLFMDDMANNACTENGWSVTDIPFNNLYLLELRHVAQGSWQPVLCLQI